MRAHVIRTDDYLQDLLEIWDHHVRESPAAAERIVGQIEAVVERLQQHPDSGERYPGFGADCRRIIAGDYVVYYRRLKDHLRILRIYHSARSIN